MRVSRIAKTEIAPGAQPVWDFIAGSRGEVRGPYQVLIRVPSLADAVAKLGSYFRFGDSLLSDAEREFATLATGRACGAVYEWLMHEPIARRVGTRPQAIDLLERDAPPEQFEPREAIIVESARALARTHRFDDDLYRRALETFGEKELVELVTLIGYYAMTASVLGAFDVTAP